MRLKNRTTGTTLSIMLGFQVLLVVIILFINFWVIPSIVTSGVKAISDDCGKRYPVEVVWGGDWFCAEKKNEH